jgi:hypothetical protein
MIRCYHLEVEAEVGTKAAVVIHQIDYWLRTKRKDGKRYGVVIDGVRYIYNTKKKWKEQFPNWGIATINRIFKKLEDLEMIFKVKYGKDRDQTRAYVLNYSHPILSKRYTPFDQNDTMAFDQNDTMFIYNTYPNKTANTTSPVVEPKFPSGEIPYSNRTRTKQETNTRTKQEMSTSEDYKKAAKWLDGLDEIDKERIEKYITAQVKQPKTVNPIGLERYVTSQVWRKHMNMPNHCDFVVTMDMDDKEIQTVQVESHKSDQEFLRRQWDADETFDEEMQKLQEEL